METQKNTQEYLGYVIPEVHDSLKIAASEINEVIGGLGFISILRLNTDSVESLEVTARRIAKYNIDTSIAHLSDGNDTARLAELTDVVAQRLTESDEQGSLLFIPVRIRCFSDTSLSELWSRTGAITSRSRSILD